MNGLSLILVLLGVSLGVVLCVALFAAVAEVASRDFDRASREAGERGRAK